MTIDMNAVSAGVERIVRKILEEREATPHPNSLAVPDERTRAGERHRVLDAYQASIGGGHSGVLKAETCVEDARRRRVQSVSSIDEMRRRVETERTHSGSEAWKLAADWLSGKVGGSDVPGGVKAMCKELGVDRLQPLSVIDAQLEKLESELAQRVESLVSQLDSWDASAVATATVRNNATSVATLPAVLSDIEAIVRER
jgi:hypothetical protein